MNKLTIYISGPITGLPENNYREFALAQEKLEAMGHKVINPHEIFEGIDTTNFTWEDYMRLCIVHMMAANLIVTLDEWHKSKGANVEVDLARKLSIPVEHAPTFFHKNKVELTVAN